jgi:hypothetical protein
VWPIKEPTNHVIHCLLNYPTNSTFLLSWIPFDLAALVPPKLVCVLTVALGCIMPPEVGGGLAASVTGLAAAECEEVDGEKVDDVLMPLLIVLKDVAAGDGSARAALRMLLMPDDM